MPESEGTEDTTQKTELEDGVSIIVPCYYDWELIRPCLESIRKQTDVDIQLILVCNKQPDATGAKTLRAKLEQYKDEYNKENNKSTCAIIYPEQVLSTEEYKSYNHSASAARNLGLQFATKTTIMFIDDDDIIGARVRGMRKHFYRRTKEEWENFVDRRWPHKYKYRRTDDVQHSVSFRVLDKHYLKYFYDAFYSPNRILTSGKQVAVVAGDRIASDTNLSKIPWKNYTKLRIRPADQEYALAITFLDHRYTCCATLLRTDIVRAHNLQFDESMRYKEDSDFILRYALNAINDDRILMPVKMPQQKVQELSENNAVKQVWKDIKADGKYYYIQHSDSITGHTRNTSSQFSWSDKYIHRRDGLKLYARLLQEIDHLRNQKGHPLNKERVLTDTLKYIQLEWKLILQSIKQDIDALEKQTRDMPEYPQRDIDVNLLISYYQLASYTLENCNEFDDVLRIANSFLNGIKTQSFKKAIDAVIDSVNSNTNTSQQDESGYEY